MRGRLWVALQGVGERVSEGTGEEDREHTHTLIYIYIYIYIRTDPATGTGCACNPYAAIAFRPPGGNTQKSPLTVIVRVGEGAGEG